MNASGDSRRAVLERYQGHRSGIEPTRTGFCRTCRQERIMAHVISTDWACSTCGGKRSITIEPASESHRGGVWDRFWANVKITDFCWNWMPPTRSAQGPRFMFQGGSMKIARVAYFLYRGTWPEGGAVRTCGNKLCVKPDHISPMKQGEVPKFLAKTGRSRAPQGVRTAACKRRHAQTGTNLYLWRDRRGCRICRNHMNRRRWRKNQRRKEAEWKMNTPSTLSVASIPMVVI